MTEAQYKSFQEIHDYDGKIYSMLGCDGATYHVEISKSKLLKAIKGSPSHHSGILVREFDGFWNIER